MTITAVTGQETGNTSNTTSVSKAFPGNVTSGNKIIVIGLKFTSSTDVFVAGDVTKSAGTATIGAVALDKQFQSNPSAGNFFSVGIFSADVTGTGSCTMQVAGVAAGGAVNMGIGEYTSDVGAISLDSGQVNTGSGNSTTPSTGNVTTTRNGIIVGGLDDGSINNPETVTPAGTYTQIYEEQNGVNFLVSSAIRRIVTGSVTDAPSWTVANAFDWAAAVAAYVEPAAAGGVTYPQLERFGFRGQRGG